MTAEIFLSDYAVPSFLVKKVSLDVTVGKKRTTVLAALSVFRNPKAKNKKAPLFLNGEEQKLLCVCVDGRELSKKEYTLTKEGLAIPALPDKAVVSIASSHDPYANTALSGFYASGSMLSTQCEAEGFRRITFYPDRPDVMATFRVTIHADKKKFPVLLANGNLIESGAEPGGRHYAVWDDPFPKPCYLFAMVAGKLDKRKSSFTTKSGRKVAIEIYVEPGKTKDADFALLAIKKAMRWDEKRFGLEYDLDRFMMVATPFFNMGAMENKGLNIFNDTCALGRTDTATDTTISFIERVVAHEYFHNWTGDRITCRDWFQLSLKEGLTVFREQEYMGDAHSIAVERLENVRDLRLRQFAEDAGALAHSVRPASYQAIDNFYTTTVYDKGAEVVRMIQTLVGREGFDRGMALYVKRHDGQAVTCDAFVQAMADANKKSFFDPKLFMRWYSQAGTPVLDVKSRYDAQAKRLTMTVRQSCPPTPGQPVKKPLLIPFAVGLLNAKGEDIIPTVVVPLKKAREILVVEGIEEKPVLSLLRDFSAPVRVSYAYTDEELLFLLSHDSDPFSRFEAGFTLATKALLDPKQNPKAFIDALGCVLRDKTIDPAFKAMMLTLPTEGELGLALKAQGALINMPPLYAVRKKLFRRIGKRLAADFEACRASLKVPEGAADGATMGRRSLRNLCLSYLAASQDKAVMKDVFAQATQSKNMTDCVAALGILASTTSPLKAKAFKAFEKKWKKAPTVMDKWFALQASAKRPGVLASVRKLTKHKGFSFKNPNRVSSLIGVFAGNGLAFHAKNGSGYRFVADMIIKLDPLNPLKAAALAKSFTRWRDYVPAQQKLMKAQLRRLAKIKTLSPNTAEVVKKSLNG
ncbi:MAG: aminopeptidase N [Alphaproteobacteria bacterium]|nr:aminopeptidase N [Alphaproteobacteria bacterium]